MTCVLIADDHEVTRRGLREIVREAFPDVEFGEAADAPSLLAQLRSRPWDLVLLDVMMPGGTVLNTLASLREIDARVPVLALTAALEVEYVVQTMRAGANGLIHKHRASDELLRAIRQVAKGGNYLHAESAAEIARLLNQPAQTKPHELLSARELDIFLRIARGCAIKEIAFDLALSDKTVATYLARIRTKTGLTDRVDIARYVLQNDLER